MLKSVILRRLIVIAASTAASMVVPAAVMTNPVLVWGVGKVGPILVDRVIERVVKPTPDDSENLLE